MQTVPLPTTLFSPSKFTSRPAIDKSVVISGGELFQSAHVSVITRLKTFFHSDAKSFVSSLYHLPQNLTPSSVLPSRCDSVCGHFV